MAKALGGSLTLFTQLAAPVRAPEFPAGLDWPESAATRLADLRGKVVLLDFWTYG